MAQPWLDADALRPGHRLPNDDGSWAVVEEVVIRPGPLQAFNLTVAKTETYFVAGALDADAVWVHNCAWAPSGEPVHGNSKKSTKAQHGYEIVDTDTGEWVKTGISSGKKNRNGTSPRANRQASQWNKTAGRPQYEAQVVKDVPAGPGARQKALDWEKANAKKLRAANELDPEKHERP